MIVKGQQRFHGVDLGLDVFSSRRGISFGSTGCFVITKLRRHAVVFGKQTGVLRVIFPGKLFLA